MTVLALVTASRDALAQPAPAPAAPDVPDAPSPAPPPPPPAAPPKEGPSVALAGYVEANYSYNFNRPSNGLTHFRGFDNRHDSFTISNAVLDGTFDYGSLSGRLALQIGHTPRTYYLAEPSSPGAAGTGGTDASYWQLIQQAYAGWKAPVGRGILLQLGVFLSPIGIEGMAIKDNWSWSRSDLFFGLPFYHTALRASYEITDRLAVSALVTNGWNSVVDNNAYKSVAAQITYKIPDRLSASVLYFGGVERPRDAPEGAPWRHLFDAWVQVDATRVFSVAMQANAGFELNRFGTSSWEALALYARLRPRDWLYIAGRFDRFWEQVPSNAAGTAAPIFWPAAWVSSVTATLDVRPHDNVSVRAEYRHDHADSAMFFRGDVQGDGSAAPFIPNAAYQNTATLGVTSWF
ncbi:outer membrane beta-barrel protein [Polyangium aurulentum]|uniref:outer membrane beta-barrel protein n=1 Tax=Polyangium aurulentum TaxID=2567896 RepID=UPI0010ADBFD3|nr:outer membrane beta-barrel protein [Polyangium aurulentum]UQA55590.1 porin [Polyangium aurulentum]